MQIPTMLRWIGPVWKLRSEERCRYHASKKGSLTLDRLPLRSRRQWRQVAEDHGAAGDRVPHWQQRHRRRRGAEVAQLSRDGGIVWGPARPRNTTGQLNLGHNGRSEAFSDRFFFVFLLYNVSIYIMYLCTIANFGPYLDLYYIIYILYNCIAVVISDIYIHIAMTHLWWRAFHDLFPKIILLPKEISVDHYVF